MINKAHLKEAIDNLQDKIDKADYTKIGYGLLAMGDVLVIIDPNNFNYNMSLMEGKHIIEKIINRRIDESEHPLMVAKELVVAAKKYL